MTRKELFKLPEAPFLEEIPLLHELYFIPTMKKHESGYRKIIVIGIRYDKDGKREWAKRITSISDVIAWNTMRKSNCSNWRIDVPSDCNCFRLFTFGSTPNINIIFRLSDFEFEIVD